MSGVEDKPAEEFRGELGGKLAQALEVLGPDGRRGLDFDGDDLASPALQDGWPSEGCCARRSSRHRGSVSCGIIAAPAAPLAQERTREKQRVEKLLEDTQVKLSVVISDIFGVSGRDMLEALIAGQRDPLCAGEDGPVPKWGIGS